MRPRSLVAILMTIALVALCAGDLAAARIRGCGAHPCCARGACKMMPKTGARWDRCGEEQTNAPQPPMLLTSVAPAAVDVAGSRAFVPLVSVASDGASLGLDRPPRA